MELEAERGQTRRLTADTCGSHRMLSRHPQVPGLHFMGGKQPRRRIAPQSLVRFRSRVRELTRRPRGKSLAQIVEELSVYLTGWRGYFGFCETPFSVARS